METVVPAKVVRLLATRPGAQEIEVQIGERLATAVNYPALAGTVEPGDDVLVNTVAVRLGLGTGGFHFVVAILSRTPEMPATTGHVIKLRYTPLQFRCLSAEEQDSPHRPAVEEFTSLLGLPVVAIPLHSMLAPVAAAVKLASGGAARVAYVMTDAAALPIAFSRLADQLKEAHLLDATVTAGQAFGGDYEAVNQFSAMIVARQAAQADVIVIGQGPGNVGTSTEYGFGAIAQGEAVNAAAALGGQPIAALRISFADARPRHQGLSRQTLTALGKAAFARAILPLPELPPDRMGLIKRQLTEGGLAAKHDIEIHDGAPAIAHLERLAIHLETMGRAWAEDREFFLAAAAAGEAAARRVQGRM